MTLEALITPRSHALLSNPDFQTFCDDRRNFGASRDFDNDLRVNCSVCYALDLPLRTLRALIFILIPLMVFIC